MSEFDTSIGDSTIEEDAASWMPLTVVHTASTIAILTYRSRNRLHYQHYSVAIPHEEDDYRLSIFSQTVKFIDGINAQNLSYKLGINKYAAMTPDEISAAKCCKLKSNLRNISEGRMIEYPPHQPLSDLPKDLNWVTRGAVNPPFNQRDCNSCYASAALGAMEGAFQIKTGHLPKFSVQQIPGDLINGRGAVPKERLDILIQELQFGPIAIQIFTDTPAFDNYRSGILDIPNCNGEPDHGMLLVGYGVDGGKPYWLLQDSLGPQRGFCNMLSDEAYRPVLNKVLKAKACLG
ncbi:cysteine proteinase 2 precursor, putative [Perkinsus marinus ATCC 50983]|uniref:Cysteine proteinase 2, putative n=1 Tax=Perkinsus marinus (strain ATCC 50983 / TXsc) TaxID=423536 RepID=C5LCA2_PERM5|nr:cysteine proteinase 2 precursor, putative [Perkinsus marinus ATCC 50983]EER05585.1 cysteine proteinase 2 precursor, putative [Perkinsus marinus ATCC 50983]|eukprot:XP_002773769.1 cysteine proteinase 2 precursor, putative [Perkinsus marinus ATCC 50983]